MVVEQFDSDQYWQRRYKRGKNSGGGSYGRLAAYKADFLNKFVTERDICSVIELGCGDGAQLALSKYPQYIGVDISPAAIEICQRAFVEDLTKCFINYDLLQTLPEQDLALSLDVIFHLVEDGVFDRYMRDLFRCSSRFVIIYSSDRDERPPSPHVRHHNFSKWISQNVPKWRQVYHETNPYPEDVSQPDDTSFADFFVYERA